MNISAIGVQDLVALAVAAGCAAWLGHRAVRHLLLAPCDHRPPDGADGFIPVEQLRKGAKKPERP